MSRLAAAHRALSQLYDQRAEGTVDHLLMDAAYLCLTSSRHFVYVNALGEYWMMIEIYHPEFLGCGGWPCLLE